MKGLILFCKKENPLSTFYQNVLSKIYILADNMFILFRGRVFQQTVGIPVPCVAIMPLFPPTCYFYSYEVKLIQGLLTINKNKVVRPVNFTFRYIDDVLSLNNSRFGDFVDRINTIDFDIKDNTDTTRSVPCLGLLLEINSEDRGRTKL